MAASIAVKCPNCDKAMQVPESLAGKKIRCKGCEEPVLVPLPKAAGKAPAKKPPAEEVFKIKDEPKPEPVPTKQPVDDDEDASAYGMTPDDSHIRRCVFCAKELVPQNARICVHCGYDMLDRKRNESKQVYESTLGDYLKHHIITILAGITIICAIALDVYCLMNFTEWFEGSIFEQDEKDLTTGKKKFWIGPGLGKVWVTLFLIFVCWYAGRFIYKMCSINFHPTEALLKE